MAKTKEKVWIDLSNRRQLCSSQVHANWLGFGVCQEVQNTGNYRNHAALLRTGAESSDQSFWGQKSSPQSVLSDVCNFLQSHSAGTAPSGQSPEGIFFIMEPRLTSQAFN